MTSERDGQSSLEVVPGGPAAEARRLFDEASQGYWDELLEFGRAMDAFRAARRRVRELERELEEEEAALRLSPEVSDGRNADERAARLTMAARGSQAVQRLRLALAHAQEELDRAEREMLQSSYRLSGYKREMDWAIVSLRLLATEEEGD